MSNPEPLKVVDRRLAEEGRYEKTPVRPGEAPEHFVIEKGDKPRAFVLVLPGQPIPRHPFRFSRLEEDGFRFLTRDQERTKTGEPPIAATPYSKRATEAAVAKVHRMFRRAWKKNLAAQRIQPQAEGVH